MSVTRFGVSLENDLLEALDEYVTTNNFPNRSQAIRQLIERNIVEIKWQCNNIVAGTIILVYDQQKRNLVNNIAAILNKNVEVLLSSQHFYFSPETCFEIIAIRGESFRLTQFSDQLIGLKGIRHGKLVMTKSE